MPEYTVFLYEDLIIEVNGVQKRYSEGDLHRPYFKTSGPAPVFYGESFSGNKVTPRKGREFSEMELPLDATYYSGLSIGTMPHFVEMIFQPDPEHSPKELRVYGWIDSVEPVSLKGPANNARIRWHVDYELTLNIYDWYKANRPNMTYTTKTWGFGSGRLLRGPVGFKRPTAIEPRAWIYDNDLNMVSVVEKWAIITAVVPVGTQQQPKATQIIYYYFQINGGIPSGCSNPQPGWKEIYLGEMDECLGVDPETLQGAWVCPFRPFTGDNAVDLPTGFAVYSTGGVGRENVDVNVYQTAIEGDDTHRYVFTDPTGAEMYNAPWGISIKSIMSWLDIGTSAANLCVYLGATATPLAERRNGEGRFFTFPLPALPITENAWSSYVYSGQRDYDIRAKYLQRKEAAVTGIANVGNQAIAGGVGGAMAGGPAGAAVGAVSGVLSGTGGTLISYYVGQDFDGRNQRITDNLVSNQAGGMIVTAGSYIAINPPGGIAGGWRMVILRPDAVSRAEIENDQDELGYQTNIYVPDCSTIIAAGGGLKIEGLKIKGDVPPEGKAQIAALFDRGVHLDLIG